MSSRPKNKNEYREELAESFAHVLEEKGLDWKKEWRVLPWALMAAMPCSMRYKIVCPTGVSSVMAFTGRKIRG